MSIRRNWDAAREKVAAEGHCRACRRPRNRVRLEAAHILSREADRLPPLSVMTATTSARFRAVWPEPYLVMPTRIVPLCGPATDPTTCHGKQHGGHLDLVPLLTLPEVLQAVHDASRLFGGNGLENARLRLVPTAERAAAA